MAFRSSSTTPRSTGPLTPGGLCRVTPRRNFGRSMPARGLAWTVVAPSHFACRVCKSRRSPKSWLPFPTCHYWWSSRSPGCKRAYAASCWTRPPPSGASWPRTGRPRSSSFVRRRFSERHRGRRSRASFGAPPSAGYPPRSVTDCCRCRNVTAAFPSPRDGSAPRPGAWGARCTSGRWTLQPAPGAYGGTVSLASLPMCPRASGSHVTLVLEPWLGGLLRGSGLTGAAASRTLADPHGPLQLVRVLEHLAAGIEGELGVIGEVLPHHPESGVTGLAPEKCGEPGFEIEDPAVRLDVGQRVQSRTQIRKGEGLVLECIELAQAARGPVLVERGVPEIAGEIGALRGRVEPAGGGDERAAVPVGRSITLDLLGIARLRLGRFELEQTGSDVPPSRVLGRLARDGIR